GLLRGGLQLGLVELFLGLLHRLGAVVELLGGLRRGRFQLFAEFLGRRRDLGLLLGDLGRGLLRVGLLGLVALFRLVRLVLGLLGDVLLGLDQLAEFLVGVLQLGDVV